MDNYNEENINNGGENSGCPYEENKQPMWSEPVIEPVDSTPAAETYSPNHYTVHEGYVYRQPEPEKPVKVKKKRKHGFLKAVCIILVSVLLSSTACYFVAGYVVDKKMEDSTNTVVFGPTGNNTDTGKTADDGEDTADSYTGDELSPAQIYSIAKNQVVGVTTEVTSTNMFGQSTSSALTGSGFIISEDGYIMTNYHVIEYAAAYGGTVTVMMHNGDKYTAQVVAHNSDNDVAVLKIEAQELDAIQYSYDLTVGEPIYAVGNPLGELTYTMTGGMVSALDRIISTTDSTTGTSKSINMFQIDAAVNSGNSGGPVYNAKGEVVGMVTAKYSSSGIEGLGFAIPIEDALNIASQLLEKGYVSGAQLGVQVLDVEEVYSAFAMEYYGYPDGICIMAVNDGSCAKNAGVLPGDIVTAIEGVSVKSVDELRTVLKKHEPGETVTLTVYRIGSTLDTGDYIDLSVVLDETEATTENTGSSQQNSAPQPNMGGFGGYWYN